VPIYAIKADGTRQEFRKEKIVNTCLSLGVTQQVADDVASRIEKRVYDGIRTKKILDLIFGEMEKILPRVAYHIDLRTALSMVNPKPDFEWFVHALLREHGYEVSPSQIVRGKCVEHEVDAIAKKQGKTYIVEAKHHFDHHTLTGLDVPRIARATIEDVTDAFKDGLTTLNIDKVMVVCNTKYSEHAQRYAECRGIELIGWGYPPGRGIEGMIIEKKLYPVTYLRNLSTGQRNRLTNIGIILVKDVAMSYPKDLLEKTGLPANVIDRIIGEARAIVLGAKDGRGT
jgi:HJR/Mrr/RecB family endonuclease